MKNYVLILLVFISSIIGCHEKNPILENPQIGTLNREDPDILLEDVINSIGLGLIRTAQNESFRSYVHTKAQQQFDGDDNVLLKTIQATQNVTGVDLVEDILLGIDTYAPLIQGETGYGITNSESDITDGVNAFPYYDRTFYLQIFVPFIDEVDLGEMPVIGLLVDNDTLLKGYELNGNGGVSVIDLTESDARNRLVWVVSINEVVNNDGNIPKDVFMSNKTEGTGKYIRLNSVYIKDKKEGWGAGRADISFVARKVLGCGTPSGAATAGMPFIKISNNQLNSWQNGFCYQLNYIAPYGGVLNPDDFQHYLFYEKDASTNNNQKTFTFTNSYLSVVNGAYSNCLSTLQYTPLYYFTKDSDYGSTISNLPVPYYEVNAGTNSYNNYKTENWGGNQFKLEASFN